MQMNSTLSAQPQQGVLRQISKIVTNRAKVDNGVYSPIYREKEEYKTDRHLVDEWEQIVHAKFKGKLKANHKAVLKSLCDHMDVDGIGSPSIETIWLSKWVDCCKRTVSSILKDLTAKEILVKYRPALEAISKRLVEVETMEREEYEALLKREGVEIKDAYEEMYGEKRAAADPSKAVESAKA